MGALMNILLHSMGSLVLGVILTIAGHHPDVCTDSPLVEKLYIYDCEHSDWLHIIFLPLISIYFVMRCYYHQIIYK